MKTVCYESSDEIFPNPERGFYAHYQPEGGGIPGQQDTPHPPLEVEELKALRSSAEGVTLLRDCILIPRRFWDEPISQGYLDEVQGNFDAVREAGLKVVPRLHYDWGMLNRDPDEEIICRHLEQMAPIFRKNADVIAWVQAGLYGGTGEGCRSDHGYVYEDQSSGGWQRLSEAGRRIYARWLELLPADRMMTIRYPRLKWDLLGDGGSSTPPTTPADAFGESASARVGYYSDGFMGDACHYAMYRLPGELEYTMADTEFVIQEGEISDGTEWKLQPGRVVAEMAKLHQTALNRGGDAWRKVSAAWRSSGDYDAITRRMGYRFRLVSANMPAEARAGERLSLSLSLANDGFARAMNPRAVEVVLRHTKTGAKHAIAVDEPRGNRLWLPGPGETVSRTVEGALPANLAAGEYELLLNLPDPYPSLRARPEYSIRLANRDLWEAETGLNRLQHVVSVAAARQLSEERPMAIRAEDIQTLIDGAAANAGVVSVPKGIYRLDARLRIDEADGLLLDGSGSTFVFTERADGGVYVTNSRRVTLRNFAIDFDPVPFTQGEVVDMGSGGEWYEIRIDAGYNPDVSVFQQNRAMKVFEGKAHRFKLDGRLVFPRALTSEEPGVFRAEFDRPIADWSNLAVGDRVAITSDRPSHAIFMDRSEACIVEGVTVLGSPGTGVLEVGGGGHRYRYTITPGPPPAGGTAQRLLSSCADGLWSVGTGKGAELHGCLMEFVGDTGVNIHGAYCEVTEVEGNRVGFRHVMGGAHFEAGDRLWAYSRAYEKKLETRVESREDAALTVASAEGIAVGDFIISPDRSGRGAVIRNSVFRDIECEAMLLRVSDALIEGNTIERNTFTGIYLGMEVGVYVEPDFVHNVTVRRNTLRQIGFQRWSRAESAAYLGAIGVGVLVPFGASVEDNRQYTDVFAGLRPNSNIMIEDNIIEECATFGIFISSTSGATVRGNRLSRTNAYAPLDAGRIFGFVPRAAIGVHDSDHVVFEGNVVSELGPFGKDAIAVDGTADADTIDAGGVSLQP